jgi:hypothetical protein
MYLDVTWQINSENVSNVHVAVPFLLNNKIKIGITLIIADESEDKGG